MRVQKKNRIEKFSFAKIQIHYHVYKIHIDANKAEQAIIVTLKLDRKFFCSLNWLAHQIWSHHFLRPFRSLSSWGRTGCKVSENFSSNVNYHNDGKYIYRSRAVTFNTRSNLLFTWLFKLNHYWNTAVFLLQYLGNSLGILDLSIAELPSWTRMLGGFPTVSWSSFIEYIRARVNLLATEDHIKELVGQLQMCGEVLSEIRSRVVIYLGLIAIGYIFGTDRDWLYIWDWLGLVVYLGLIGIGCIFGTDCMGFVIYLGLLAIGYIFGTDRD